MIASTRHSRLDSPRLAWRFIDETTAKENPFRNDEWALIISREGNSAEKLARLLFYATQPWSFQNRISARYLEGRVRNPDFPVVTEGRKKGETGHARSSSVSFFRVTRADSIRDSSGVEATASGGRHTHPSSSVSRPRPRNVPSMRFHLTLQHCCCDHVSLYVASVQLSHASF